MMDPMANLDMEKKMGFGMKDVDEFLEKAKEVEQKINTSSPGRFVEQLEREAGRTEGRSRGGEGGVYRHRAKKGRKEAKEKVEEHARRAPTCSADR